MRGLGLGLVSEVFGDEVTTEAEAHQDQAGGGVPLHQAVDHGAEVFGVT